MTYKRNYAMDVRNLDSYGRILKAILSLTRKNSNSSDVKNFLSAFISFFFDLKARLQVHKFEFLRIKVG